MLAVNPLEVLGVVTGAACVWLAARQRVANFPVGIANNLVFLALFAGAGLYAGAGLQVVYLALAALGWWWWTHGRSDAGLVVRRTPRLAWAVLAVACGLVTWLLWTVLSGTDSPAPFLDSLTTATSLVAQLMLGRKWLGNWAVWIATDVLLVGLYVSQGLWLTAALYAGFIVLCVDGARRWRDALVAAADGPPEPPAPSTDPVPDDAADVTEPAGVQP